MTDRRTVQAAILNAARTLAQQDGYVFEWRSGSAQAEYLRRAAAIIDAYLATRQNMRPDQPR